MKGVFTLTRNSLTPNINPASQPARCASGTLAQAVCVNRACPADISLVILSNDNAPVATSAGAVARRQRPARASGSRLFNTPDRPQ